ncbi:MAG: hypothetical protein RL726_1326, partial [Actinomycetota bacterium]
SILRCATGATTEAIVVMDGDCTGDRVGRAGIEPATQGL